MSNVVKWGLLGAGLVAIIALCSGFGLLDGMANIGPLITRLVSLFGNGLLFGRQMINLFLTIEGRLLLNGLLFYMMFRWVVVMGVKILATVYHFIFRG